MLICISLNYSLACYKLQNSHRRCSAFTALVFFLLGQVLPFGGVYLDAVLLEPHLYDTGVYSIQDIDGGSKERLFYVLIALC